MSDSQEARRDRQLQLRMQEMMANGWGGIDPSIVERFASNNPAGIDLSWGLKPGSTLTQDQFDQMIATLGNEYQGAAGITGSQYLADPRSAIKVENGQYVYRPEQSLAATTGEDFYGIDRANGFWDGAGPFALALAGFALPYAASLGALGAGAGETAAAAGSSGGSGGLMEWLAQAATGTSGLSQAELAALIESGTTGTAGAALESAAGLGTAGLGDIAATALANGTGAGGSVVNGASSLLGGSGTSTLGNLLELGSGTTDILGKLLGAGVGYLGSKETTGALTDLQNNLNAQRAPFLNKAVGYLNNPESFYSSPEATGAANAAMRALSAQYGNPVSSPTAQSIATGALYDRYSNTVNSLGSLGLSGQGIQANLGSQIAQGAGQPYAIAGNLIGGATTPSFNVDQLLSQAIAKQFGGSGYRLP